MATMSDGRGASGLRGRLGWKFVLAVLTLVVLGVWAWTTFVSPAPPARTKASGVVANAPAPVPVQPAVAQVTTPAPHAVAPTASAPAKVEKSKVVTKVAKAPKPAPQASAPALASAPQVALVETPKVTPVPMVTELVKPKQLPSSKLFRWTKVGGDPCNPKVGCTLEWALEKTGWPQKVQVALMAAVKGSSPETITITSGLGGSKGPTWSGWMTWGKHSPKFEMNTVAAWPDGQHEPASMWSYEDDEDMMGYTLIKVKKCGNWGGSTRVIHKKPPPVHVATAPTPQPQQPAMMPFGNNPGLGAVACIDE